MKCGLITEGKSDQAVLTNILKGQLGIDRSDIVYLQPENFFDETDLNTPSHKMDKSEFSNWLLVKQECINKEKISDFFDNPIDDKKLLIIQIDTAETYIPEYGINKPDKKNNENYVIDVVNLVSNKIDEWIGKNDYNIIYSICVEETDAWILTIYTSDNIDTGLINNPKHELSEVVLPKKFKTMQLKELNNLKAYDKYNKLTEPFRKKKDLKKYSNKNKSLKHFCKLIDEIELKLQEESE